MSPSPDGASLDAGGDVLSGSDDGVVAGQRLGDFVLLDRAGSGAFGTVWRARQVSLDRLAAVKLLQLHVAFGESANASFLREARIAAQLDHPGAAHVYGFGSERNGMVWMAMEWIPGRTLARVLEAGPLPPAVVARFVVGLGEVVKAAHDRGIVHRDIKPANVMIQERDGALVPRLLDLGVARRRHGSAEGAAGVLATFRSASGAPLPANQTVAGDLFGTPRYMAPEQWRDAHAVGPPADQYSLAALAWECLAGAPPFLSASIDELARLHASAEPVGFVGSPEVEAVLRRGLAKSAEDRWPSAFDFASSLAGALLGSGTEIGGQAVLAWRAPGAAEAQATADPEPSTPLNPTFVNPARHQLPAERDRFVGRLADLDALDERLRSGARLVTLVGHAGSGKTRLVTHYAWRSLGELSGGAWFCNISDATNEEGIVRAVASSLDVPLAAVDPIVHLGRAIAGRGRCLIVLDNFEQVARFAAVTLGKWLDRAPEAQFLVTSREVLRLPGEVCVTLAPLSQAEAVALFVQRAQDAQRDFAVPAGDEGVVRDLVKLLDHLPLAIELAAARVPIMAPRTLLARLGERFKLLKTASGRQRRHATLRGALDWSWELLNAEECDGLAQLSCFEGGFSLPAAEAVLSVGEAWAADVVESLIGKSLVRRVTDERFDMLVSVQAYAAERLESSGARAAVELRHAAFYAALGTDSAVEGYNLRGGAERRAAVTRELANLVVACQRMTTRGELAVATQLLQATWATLELSGPFSTALSLAEALLASAELTRPQRARAAAVAGRATNLLGLPEGVQNYLELARQDFAAVGERLLEARLALELARHNRVSRGVCEVGVAQADVLTLARDAGDQRLEGLALAARSESERRAGAPDAARVTLTEALACLEAAGDERSEANIRLSLLCHDLVECTDVDVAGELDRLALTVRRFGDRRLESRTLNNLAVVQRLTGRLDEAEQHYCASRMLARDLGDRVHECTVTANLGDLMIMRGRLDDALPLLQEALVAAREVGSLPAEGLALAELGNVYRQQGRWALAQEHLNLAVAVTRQFGEPTEAGRPFAYLAELALDRGDRGGAEAWLAEAAACASAADAGDASELGQLLNRVRVAMAAHDPRAT